MISDKCEILNTFYFYLVFYKLTFHVQFTKIGKIN